MMYHGVRLGSSIDGKIHSIVSFFPCANRKIRLSSFAVETSLILPIKGFTMDFTFTE